MRTISFCTLAFVLLGVTVLSAPVSAQPTTSQRAATDAVSGLGMYVWQWHRSGTVDQVVAHAKNSHISHLIVRASDQRTGFYLAPILGELLPKAHAAGIKVVAYDPPKYENIEADVERARVLATFRSGDHAIDAFAADIEPAAGLTAEATDLYGRRLREVLGPDYPMIAIVYPPQQIGGRFPFTEAARHFDVLAPMSYWRSQTLDGPGYMRETVERLKPFGRPVSVSGQAFSYATHRRPELRGHPTREEFEASIASAKASGAVGMTFWVWEHAEPWVFESIAAANWLRPEPEPAPIPEPTPAPVVQVVAPSPTPLPAPTGPVPPAAVRLDAAPAAERVPSPNVPATLAVVMLAMAAAAVLEGRRIDPAAVRRAVRSSAALVGGAAGRAIQPLVAVTARR